MTAATIIPVAGKEDYSMEAIQITSIEVVILVHTSGVNFIDVYFRDNYYKAPLPLIPGAEGSGYIAAQAEGVSGFEVGGVTVHYTLISTDYVRTREQMTAIMDAVCGQDLGVLIRPACALEDAVSAQRNLESPKATGTRALCRGAGMEIKRTRTRTRNEPRQFKTVPLRMGPTSCSLENRRSASRARIMIWSRRLNQEITKTLLRSAGGTPRLPHKRFSLSSVIENMPKTLQFLCFDTERLLAIFGTFRAKRLMTAPYYMNM
jgi:hypothetical protein